MHMLASVACHGLPEDTCFTAGRTHRQRVDHVVKSDVLCVLAGACHIVCIWKRRQPHHEHTPADSIGSPAVPARCLGSACSRSTAVAAR